jgi:GT2 family glycosyltransferase
MKTSMKNAKFENGMNQEAIRIGFSLSDRKDSENPTVSVIIVNFNGKKFLEECIPSLIIQTCKNLEIIVVDNASSDGSVEYLKSHFEGLVIIENKSNLGFAEGANTGIRNSRGPYILTLNNDTRVEGRCIEGLLQVMNSDDVIGMCAPKMLFPDGRINSTGICISRSGAAWDRGMFEEDRGQYNSPEEIFGPCGGAALFRRKMFDEIGLFDKDFFLYMEDVDIAFRGQLAGWKCMFVPEAVVYHHHCGTTGFMSDLSIYYGNRNILLYPMKNFPFGTLVISMPWILGRTIAIIPYGIMRGKGKIILKSKIDGLFSIPRMLKKRKYIRRTVPEAKINRFFTLSIKFNNRSHVDH